MTVKAPAETGTPAIDEPTRPRSRRRSRGSHSVLVVEADEAYRAVIDTCVRLAGCRAETVVSSALAMERLDGESFDVIVWACGPEEDRPADAVALLRAKTDGHVVLLTEQFDAAMLALEAGADQVLPKPFVPSALVGALRAALRRSPALMMHLASRVEIRGMTFDAGERSLRFDGAHVSFTAQEWDLLAVFLSHPNRFLTAREIVRLGWRAGAHEAEQIRTYVRRLRQKLEPLGTPLHLVSQHSRGYCLVVD
jgi:DNA-binding response OmpR family regulator